MGTRWSGSRAGVGGRRSASRLVFAIVSTVVFAAAIAGSSWAGTSDYWGFNNLSSSNPGAGTACAVAEVGGWACTGFNYWDQSDADWRNYRGYFKVGFICESDGYLWGPEHGGNESYGVYGAWWSTWCPTHYNRVAVAHLPGDSGQNYLQALKSIWP